MLDIFLEGEKIKLCIPTLDFVKNSNWYQWTNHHYAQNFTNFGAMPNTQIKQKEYFQTCNNEKRITLIITTKNLDPIGSISISNIDHQTKQCEISILTNTFSSDSPLLALEAIAIMTQHSFLKIGIQRITAKQHIGLISWSHRMSLLGYRLEGIEKNSFIKGIETADMIRIAAHYEDYQKIIAHRGGQLWDSQKQMFERLKKLPKKPIHKELQDFFKEHEHYYEEIFQS